MAGESIALVSDAGTPLVSDPGDSAGRRGTCRRDPGRADPRTERAHCGAVCVGAGRREFLFVGFPPSRAKDRHDWFVRLMSEPRVLVLYEAPHRIRATLQAMLDTLGDRAVALGRELTKAHEQMVVRPISELLGSELEERGEFTIVVSGEQPKSRPAQPPSPAEVAYEFGLLTNDNAVSASGADLACPALQVAGQGDIWAP